VERAVVSSSGEWMATVDAREEDEVFHGERYLKIWWWDQKSGHWILNTRVDRPHGLGRVTDLSFSSSSPVYLATAGEDGNAKIWGMRTVKNRAGEAEGKLIVRSLFATYQCTLPDFWANRSTFNIRSEMPKSLSWSFDSSLLAISLGPHVAVYDPESNVIRETISSPECPVTRAVCFVGRGRYLVIVGSQEIVLWDLVLQSGRFTFTVKCSSVDLDTPSTMVVSHSHANTTGYFART